MTTPQQGSSHPSPSPAGGMPAFGLLLACSVVLAFGVCYGSVIVELFRQCQHSEQSYGYLIPVISGYLLWTRRDRLRLVPRRTMPLAGAIVLGAGLVLKLVGRAAGMILLEELSLLASLAGAVLALFGWRILRASWFSIAYLIFLVPVWDLLGEPLIRPMQEISADIATWLLEAARVTVYRDGLYLFMEHASVEVAEACSGIHYLMSTFAIGIPLAYLTLRSWTRRVILLVFALTLAVLGNGLRVALVSLLFNSGHMRVEDGVLHAFQAVLVSWIGFAALGIGVVFLSRIPYRGRASSALASPGTNATVPGAAFPSGIREAGATGSTSWGLLLPLGLLIAATIVGGRNPEPYPLARPLASLPLELRGYAGKDLPLGSWSWRSPGADSELLRSYRHPSGRTATIYVAYYAWQRQQREAVNLVTRELGVAATRLELPTTGGNRRVIARKLQQEGATSREILFWYQSRGRIAGRPSLAMATLAWDSLVRGRSCGAVVMVADDARKPPLPELGESAAQELAASALLALEPILP